MLVVMFHVQLIDKSTNLNHPFCREICQPFNPIRMPLFIFSSGGLLYLSRIRKNWDTRALYSDKFRRILIPFVFFVTFFFLLKVAFTPIVKTQVPLTLHSFLESFYLFHDHPSAHLWFLAVLTWFMLLYPLFKYLCAHPKGLIAFFLFSCAAFFADFPPFLDQDYFCIVSLNKYLVFFVGGITFFRFELHKYISGLPTFLFLVASYTLFLLVDVPLLTSLTGILAMVNLSQLVASRLPGLFSSFRDYIYQIYLMSFIFQPFVELVLWQRFFYDETLFPLFYVLNVLAGIYPAVIVTRLIERSNCRLLKMCIGLK